MGSCLRGVRELMLTFVALASPVGLIDDAAHVGTMPFSINHCTNTLGVTHCKGGGFIMASELPALLTALGLDAGPENVARITKMMDGDIVLLTTFLEVQYPGIQRDSGPSDFVLYHYNGIPRSEGAPLQYSRGTAKTEAPRDFGSGTAMLQVLRTRWPRLEVDWSEPVSIS